jgi:hypothetical protein
MLEVLIYLTIGIALIFLGGKDPWSALRNLRKEGKSLTESLGAIVPMFILPWPRTVNKRLIWLVAGAFLVGSSIKEFFVGFL